MRPQNLKSVIGQEQIKERLQISIDAAKKTQQVLPHILFDGPPGLGKTSLAEVVANELGADIQIANGANLRAVKNIMPYLMRTSYGTVLFIDEIHRCNKMVEEFLYPVMEDFRVDVGKKDVMTINLSRFTLIGATTNSGALSKPFYDRFALKFTLDFYTDDELSSLVKSNSEVLNIDLPDDAAKIIGSASRGTPRVAKSYLKWVMDFSISQDRPIDSKLVKDALELSDIGLDGTTKQDKVYLEVLNVATEPVGLATIEAVTGLGKDTILDTIEPFLLRKGIIKRTKKGRILSDRAKEFV